MNAIKLVKKILMPYGLCAVPLVEKKESKNLSMEPNKKLIRPSELAIYNEDVKPQEQTRQNEPPSFLEEGFGNIRRSYTSVIESTTGYRDSITRTIDTGLAHSQGALDFLQEESNTLPKIGAVAIGGLTGFILGLRGGKFKRIVYTSTGALTIAMICNPRQAQETWQLANLYANIAYNFVYGVKPGDEKRIKMPWPDITNFKIPSSFSEISDLAISAGNAVADKISSLAGKDSEIKNDKKENKSTSDGNK